MHLYFHWEHGAGSMAHVLVHIPVHINNPACKMPIFLRYPQFAFCLASLPPRTSWISSCLNAELHTSFDPCQVKPGL